MPRYTPTDTPVLDGVASQITVAKFDGTSKYTLLPNVWCSQIQKRKGAVPAAAQFRYVSATWDISSPWPSQFEQVWPVDAASGPYVAAIGDRIVVLATSPAGVTTILFDGFVTAPQVDLDSKQQSVTFAAAGYEVRAWDTPVPGAVYRDSGTPTDTTAAHQVQTVLPARCNPDGRPNCTPDGSDVDNGSDTAYPVFLDARLEGSPAPQTYWTLGKLTRYLLYQSWTEPAYSLNSADVDAYLVALKATGSYVDVTNPSSYTTAPIVLDDLTLHNHPWPEVIDRQFEKYGFAFTFEPGQTSDSPPLPAPTIRIYRDDGLSGDPPKQLSYQPLGAPLDPAQTTFSGLHLVRDAHSVVRQIVASGRPDRYEISVLLAPGYSPAEADAADAGAIAAFSIARLATASAAQRKKYRWYVADEDGSGHWSDATSSWVTGAPLSLNAVLGAPVSGTRQYANRARPGIDELLSLDDSGRPYRAELAVSTNYAGATPPCLWDGSGTWQSLGSNGWRLLKDRLGIEVTADNPNAWHLPRADGTTLADAGNVLRGVEAQAAPSATIPMFDLRLTVVIEADQAVTADTLVSLSSCVPFSIQRRVDLRDVYRKDTVHSSSLHAPGAPTAGVTTVTHDDTAALTAYAEALQRAKQHPPCSGPVTIPGLALTWKIGDRIDRINGRNVTLQQNTTTITTESPTLPTVVAITYHFGEDGQTTTLDLATKHHEPVPDPKPPKALKPGTRR